MRYVLSLLALSLAGALPAHGQETFDQNACTRAWEARDKSAVKGLEPTAAISRSASLRLDCDIVSVYFRYSNWDKPPTTGNPAVYHFARLVSVRDGKASEQWADSRKCPALGQALKSLAAIRPPDISIPGYQTPPTGPMTIQLDGDGFRLFNVRGVEFSGDQASPLGKWMYASLKSLAGCWSPQAPTLSR